MTTWWYKSAVLCGWSIFPLLWYHNCASPNSYMQTWEGFWRLAAYVVLQFGLNWIYSKSAAFYFSAEPIIDVAHIRASKQRKPCVNELGYSKVGVNLTAPASYNWRPSSYVRTDKAGIVHPALSARKCSDSGMHRFPHTWSSSSLGRWDAGSSNTSWAIGLIYRVSMNFFVLAHL